jgi:hypothetical protein
MKKLSAKQTIRISKVTTKLRNLETELRRFQARTVPVVEELDNFELANDCKFPWTPEVKAKYKTMRDLITKIEGWSSDDVLAEYP